MLRLTRLEDVLFPVAERTVCAMTPEGPVDATRYKALFNAHTNQLLSIVDKSYKVVTHQKVLEWARESCTHAFEHTREEDWVVGRVNATATGSHCHIDLIHRTGKLDFCCLTASGRPDRYGPFIRLTNGYGKSSPPRLSFGLMREANQNAMIAPISMLEIRLPHQVGPIPSVFRFEECEPRWKVASARFRTNSILMLAAKLPRMEFTSRCLEAFGWRAPNPECDSGLRLRQWAERMRHVETLSDQYTSELGENHYALFNVLTDFASRPPPNAGLRSDADSLQRTVGKWYTLLHEGVAPRVVEVVYSHCAGDQRTNP